MSHNPKIMEMEGFSGCPKMSPKSYLSKMKQNNSTELSGLSFRKIYNKNDPPDPPQTPNLDLSRIPYRKSAFFRLIITSGLGLSWVMVPVGPWSLARGRGGLAGNWPRPAFEAW